MVPPEKAKTLRETAKESSQSAEPEKLFRENLPVKWEGPWKGNPLGR